MRGCFILATALVLGACGNDDPAPGTRGICASGGAINECPDFPRTPEGACEKLVACGVPRDTNDSGFDWGECVDFLYSLGNDGSMDFTIACLVASTCDQLASDYCGEFGPNP